MYIIIIKRSIDLVFSGIGILCLSPILIIVFIILCFTNKGKPVFVHERPGKNEKLFRLYKFKSMNDKRDDKGEFLPFDQRVTRFGNFIRKYSLDEIPQLINVLKGEMSLIGPRPLLVQYLPLYTQFQKKRHNVKPGITGWAQVNGRNTIKWVKKFEYDVWYVEHISFMLDLKIIFFTLKKVIKKENVNSSENLNMTTFSGGHDE